jgi:glutathione synthase/RimK-type ligase-like ATP-grasp enzyme
MTTSGPRVLVTGSGGLAGVNFVRALRASKRRYYIVGTDFNRYHLVYPDVDLRLPSPRHSDKTFIPRIAGIVKDEKLEFLHAQPSSEAYVIATARKRIPCKVFLPESRVMKVGQDKLVSQEVLSKKGVPVAKTFKLRDVSDIEKAFSEMGGPLWVRARHGAGGRLSLLCNGYEEARHWVELWVLRGSKVDEFIVQEYLPGKNIAWDSIWYQGKLITSYARERLEYPFKHISPSGITGTPSVARIIVDDETNRIAASSVQGIDSRPHGAYSVDLKESATGTMCVTEVDSGKFHSTMPLWGYIAVKHLGMPWFANLADLYVRLGLGEDVKTNSIPQTDLFPPGYYLLRDMDVGAYLWKEDGWKEKVL